MKKLNTIPKLGKPTLLTWWICRLLLFVWGVWGLAYGYTTMFVQATFAIIFTHLWDMFQLFGGRSFITKMPAYLQTELNIFTCFGCVVGSTLNNFTDFDKIDLPEHFYAGFLACSFGFVLCEMMQGERHKIKPSVQALFGMAIGVSMLVGWEFYEFTMDRLYGYDLQHALPYAADGALDTMIDLIVGSAGALFAMFFEAFRRVGLFGKNKERLRAEYLAQRAEAKRDKALAYQTEEVSEETENVSSDENVFYTDEELLIEEDNSDTDEEPVDQKDKELEEDRILKEIFKED